MPGYTFRNTQKYIARSDIPNLTITVTGTGTLTSSDIDTAINNFNPLLRKYVKEIKFSGYTDMSAGLSYDYSSLTNLEYVWLGDVRYSASVLPIYEGRYVKVEYIESTGTQYIDTQIVSNLNSGDIKLKYQMLSLDTDKVIFGTNIGSQTYLSTSDQNYQLYCRYGFSSVLFLNYDLDNIYNFEMNKNGIVMNGISRTFGVSGTTQNTGNLFLCAYNSNGVPNAYSQVRVYEFQYLEGTSIVRNFLPAYNTATHECGLYDTVNNQWYGNAGTGRFKGSLKGYEICEYIESSGTQYIDTGIVPTANTSSILEVAFTSTVNQRNGLFGGAYGRYYIAQVYNENIRTIFIQTSTYPSITYDTNFHTYTIDTVNQQLKIDNNTPVLISETFRLSYNGSIALFGCNDADVPIIADKCYQKVKYYVNNENTTPKLHLIPVKKNNEYFMIDISNKRIKEYHNSGTGSFTGA